MEVLKIPRFSESAVKKIKTMWIMPELSGLGATSPSKLEVTPRPPDTSRRWGAPKAAASKAPFLNLTRLD